MESMDTETPQIIVRTTGMCEVAEQATNVREHLRAREAVARAYQMGEPTEQFRLWIEQPAPSAEAIRKAREQALYTIMPDVDADTGSTAIWEWVI